MPLQVSSGATLVCDFGTGPGNLTCQSSSLSQTPIATIFDNQPLINISPFAMCISLQNPVVAQATAAAAGVLVPCPCMPATMRPWDVGSTKVVFQAMPVLTKDSTLSCAYGGTIRIVEAGQNKVGIP